MLHHIGMVQQRRNVNNNETSSLLMHQSKLRSISDNGSSSSSASASSKVNGKGLSSSSSFHNNNHHRKTRKGLHRFILLFMLIPLLFALYITYKFIVLPQLVKHNYVRGSTNPFTRTSGSSSSSSSSSSKSSTSSSITSERRKSSDVEITTMSGGYEYHIVFSTGCSLYQDWQSYIFFYGAAIANQPGTITRIVSGCASTEEEEKMRTIFMEEIHPMEPTGRFQIHFTPDYSKLANGKSFVYFNKPFGMKHWLENALGFPNAPINEDAIIILVDPDQLIMRPFTNNDFSNTEWKFVPPDHEPYTQVKHGYPMGQLYGFGLQWKNQVNMTALGFPNSPVNALSYKEAQAGYIVGPPYVATARDMYKIVHQWTIFAHGVHAQYPYLLAEMFAYCLGAAHVQLSHQTARSFMISDIGMGRGEGWSYIDKIPDNEICTDFNVSDVPNVLHYCQRYGMGKYYFGKRKLPKDFLSCHSPLLAEPPNDVLHRYNYAIFPGRKRKEWTPIDAKRNAFSICYMIKVLNEAATHYKDQHCDKATANYAATLFLSEGAPPKGD